MSFSRTLLAFSALMMLAGCATSDDRIPVPVPRGVPPLSAQDEEPCPDPEPKPGADARAEVGRQRLALKECRQRHGRVVQQYHDVEKENWSK